MPTTKNKYGIPKETKCCAICPQDSTKDKTLMTLAVTATCTESIAVSTTAGFGLSALGMPWLGAVLAAVGICPEAAIPLCFINCAIAFACISAIDKHKLTEQPRPNLGALIKTHLCCCCKPKTDRDELLGRNAPSSENDGGKSILQGDTGAVTPPLAIQ